MQSIRVRIEDTDMNIKIGDVITLKPEWMDSGDENFTFRAVENSGSDRVLVTADEYTMAIKPTHMIKFEWISKVN